MTEKLNQNWPEKPMAPEQALGIWTHLLYGENRQSLVVSFRIYICSLIYALSQYLYAF